MPNSITQIQFFDAADGGGICHRDWPHVPRIGDTVLLNDVLGKAASSFKVVDVIWSDNRDESVMPRVHLKETTK